MMQLIGAIREHAKLSKSDNLNIIPLKPSGNFTYDQV
jgi:hypothetical protein